MMVKTLIICIVFVLCGCATEQASKQQGASNLIPPALDKAINMTVPHEPETVYSVYGVSLGERKSSVDKKYNLVACRKDIFYLRCAVLLDTREVTGISSSEKTTIFIAFEDDRVRDMGVPIFPASLKHTRDMLDEIYGAPASRDEEKVTWSNSSGSIVLQQSRIESRPSLVKYSVN